MDSYRGQANDPLSLNLYTYCHNNPVMYIDPSGHREIQYEEILGESEYDKLSANEQYLYAQEQFATTDSVIAYYYWLIQGMTKNAELRLKNATDFYASAVAAEPYLSYEDGEMIFNFTLAYAMAESSAKIGKAMGSTSYADYAKTATKNANSSEVVLGKYNPNGLSYNRVAQGRGATYFELDNWDDIVNAVGKDNMWNINENFLQQQIAQGKSFTLTHTPYNPTGYYAKEIEFLSNNGYKFIQDGSFWKAVK